MDALQPWWKVEAPRFLADALAHINRSRRREEPVDRCEDLCKALNKTWNAHYAYRRRHGGLTEREAEGGRSDAQAFTQLLLGGLDDGQVGQLCDSEGLTAFAGFSTQIMNHDTLLRREYDPRDIPEKLRKEACDEHRQLLNALKYYAGGPKDRDQRERLLRKLGQLLYVVRSNIAHSEKTPRGPDLDKSERDRAIGEAASRVIEEFFDLLFEHPSRRLASYGTLAPGEVNHAIVADLVGQWGDGAVRGELTTSDGFRRFRWSESGSEVAVRVLTSIGLPEHFSRIDRFEGRRYARSLVPVDCAGILSVCNTYEAA
jgi:gamma-glutamylcyclotransferase (GGCT)/AIG2-like uncharacterized protein YtfP